MNYNEQEEYCIKYQSIPTEEERKKIIERDQVDEHINELEKIMYYLNSLYKVCLTMNLNKNISLKLLYEKIKYAKTLQNNLKYHLEISKEILNKYYNDLIVWEKEFLELCIVKEINENEVIKQICKDFFNELISKYQGKINFIKEKLQEGKVGSLGTKLKGLREQIKNTIDEAKDMAGLIGDTSIVEELENMQSECASLSSSIKEKKQEKKHEYDR